MGKTERSPARIAARRLKLFTTRREAAGPTGYACRKARPIGRLFRPEELGGSGEPMARSTVGCLRDLGTEKRRHIAARDPAACHLTACQSVQYDTPTVPASETRPVAAVDDRRQRAQSVTSYRIFELSHQLSGDAQGRPVEQAKDQPRQPKSGSPPTIEAISLSRAQHLRRDCDYRCPHQSLRSRSSRPGSSRRKPKLPLRRLHASQVVRGQRRAGPDHVREEAASARPLPSAAWAR